MRERHGEIEDSVVIGDRVLLDHQSSSVQTVDDFIFYRAFGCTFRHIGCAALIKAPMVGICTVCIILDRDLQIRFFHNMRLNLVIALCCHRVQRFRNRVNNQITAIGRLVIIPVFRKIDICMLPVIRAGQRIVCICAGQIIAVDPMDKISAAIRSLRRPRGQGDIYTVWAKF